MKILLIQPANRAIGFTNMIIAEPLGLEAIAGGLKAHDVKIIDLRLHENRLVSVLSSFMPDLCGISCTYTIDYYPVINLIRTIRRYLPETFIVVGGHHASLNCQDFSSTGVDAVVIGEGEHTFIELIGAIERDGDISDVKGLAINEGGRLKLNSPRPIEDGLDSLPIPLRNKEDRRYYHLGFQRPLALVETARGCTYSCSFCGVWQFYQKRYRAKAPERVVEELEAIKEPYILFVDDNFLANVKRAERIAQLIRSTGIKKAYTFQARSDSIVKNPDVIKLWREIGLKGVFIGFEKVEDSGLNRLRKENLVKNNTTSLSILKGLNIDVWASFIVDPEFGEEDFQRLKDYIIKNRIKTPTFAVLTPLPGTELFEDLKERLTTRDYNLYDIAHAVLPTRLPLQRFYTEFCSLYKLPYSRYQLIWEGFIAWLSMGFSLPHLLRMLFSARRLSNPSDYLAAHQHTPDLPISANKDL